MLQLLICAVLGLLMMASWAQGTATRPGSDRNPPSAPGKPPDPCSFIDRGLPADTIVVAAGSYSGRPIDFQIDRSGNQASQFDVAVHAEKPVALLLAAYDPSVWSIIWSRDTRIVAVFATGYHRQVVAGLPRNVPVITSSYDEKSPCGYNYLSSEQSVGWLNPRARSVFGMQAIRLYNKPIEGRLDIVESTRPKTDYETSLDVRPESFRVAGTPLANTAGLNDALARGLLRRVTAADAEMVRRHYQSSAANAPRGDVPPIAGGDPSGREEVRLPWIPMDRGFVVLKPFVYPAGLYGGHAASFIVPRGVVSPTGNPGHSTVIDLNRSAACESPGCR